MKASKVLIILLVVVVIFGLSLGWCYTWQELSKISFCEGEYTKPTETDPGLVTVSFNGWVIHGHDDSNSPIKGTVGDLFCEIHNEGLMHSCQEGLVKLYYTERITVEHSNASTEVFYKVGDYYVTAKLE